MIASIEPRRRYARSLAATQKGDFTSADAETLRSRASPTIGAAGGRHSGDRCLEACARRGRRAPRTGQGDSKAAIAFFEEAATLQDGLRYTEPPFWYYPVRQTLAAALLQAGRLDEAEAQFKRALERAPNNGWSYYGLSRVYAAQGNAAAAKQAEENLAKTWIGNRSLLQLSKL
jgi:tetratricopeptide (TPR) repeat protein